MTLDTHNQARILLIDGNRYDRDLLTLSLRNQFPNVDILDANSAVDFAQHLASGTIDAVIAEPRLEWSNPFDLAPAVRRLNPSSPFCLFTGVNQQVSDDDCIGFGVDANVVKDSQGFLELPRILADRFKRNMALQRLARIAGPLTASSIVPIATFIITDGGEVQSANAAFETILKLPRYRFADLSLEELFASADDRARWRRMFSVKRADDALEVLSVNIVDGSGSHVPVRIVARPVEIGDTEERYWSAVLLDQSMLGESGGSDALPLRLVGKNKDLELGHMLSHDLQQPLQNVIRQARWLIDHYTDAIPGEAAETATHIYSSAAKMQAMIDGAIALTRIDASRREAVEVDLEKVVRTVLEDLRVLIEETGATVECGSMPSVMGNEAQLIQLFQNLVGNAIKYHGDRLPRVKITSVKVDGQWRIQVSDNGMGIREEDLPRIFDLFQRLHTDDEIPGTGVGLAICKRIIESHQGRISVESTVGRGTVFTVELSEKSTQAA